MKVVKYLIITFFLSATLSSCYESRSGMSDGADSTNMTPAATDTSGAATPASTPAPGSAAADTAAKQGSPANATPPADTTKAKPDTSNAGKQ
jgi:hypothetical protein